MSVKCPHCRSKETKPIYRGTDAEKEIIHYLCENCGLVFTDRSD